MKKESIPVIRDDEKLRISMRGTIKQKAQLSLFKPEVKFIGCGKLAVPMILDGEFGDSFVEAIYPPVQCVLLEHCSTIPIIRKAETRTPVQMNGKEVPLKPPPPESAVMKLDRGQKIAAGKQVRVTSTPL